jgi:hypothetical protein
MSVRIIIEQVGPGYVLSTEGTGAGDYERRTIHPASLLSALSSLDLAVAGTALHCWLTGDPLGAIHQDPPRVPPVPPVDTVLDPVTVLDLASHRLGYPVRAGGDFQRAGLPIMGGCAECGATVAAYNACPSRSGYLKCASDCIGDDGYATVEEAHADIFPGERAPLDPPEERTP